MKTIYIVIDGVAVGAMEVEETDAADMEYLLDAVKRKHRDAKSVAPYEEGSSVFIVSTNES